MKLRTTSVVALVVVCAALLALVPAAAVAQTGSGTIKGTVSDATHAVIPHAKVTLANLDTNVVKIAETSDVGAYYFGANPPGRYTILVEQSGFRKWTVSMTLEVGQTATLDAALEVGIAESTVEVTGAAPVITTEGAQVSDVKDALRIHELPLNGRQITTLFNLTPGVEGGANPRVNGMKVGSAEMLLDGVSLVDRFGGGMATVQPGLDTVQEYRVETAGSNAEYSRPATVALVTKSGTNEIHGSAFETHRNNFAGLRARQRQDSNAKPPEYIRNEFGASAGGPIVKNKTFWFGSYEGQKQRQNMYAEAQAPTDAIWGGDFSGAMTPNHDPVTIFDPLTTRADGTRDPFPGNIIPTNRISPFTATMKGISAAPNVAGANPWTDINFKTYYPNLFNYGTYTAKIDQIFSEKDTVSGRFTHSSSDSTIYGNWGGYPQPGSTNAGGTSRQDNGLTSAYVRWNHVFTPTLLNEFQVAANRSPSSQGALSDNTNWANKLGLPNPFGATGWPSIFTADNSPFYYYGGWDSANRKDQKLTTYNVEDNVTWIKGKHTIRFGVKASKELDNVRENQQAQGSHTFYGDWTSLYDPAAQQKSSFSGSGFASMELGLPEYLSNQYNRGYFYFRQMNFGPYAQDTWRVSQRLTLTLGMRWDKWTVYKEKYDRLVNIDLASAGTGTGMQVITPNNTTMESIPGIPPAVLQSWATRGLTWTTANKAGFPSGLLPADNNNFAPRLGLAYQVAKKTVLRMGYGTYYWTMPLSQILQSSRINPPLNLRFVNNIQTANNTNYNYALSSAPPANDYIGQAQVDITGNQSSSLNGAQPMMPWDARNWSDNKAQEWTFTLEREVMKDTALRLSYIGNHGSDLEQRWAWNTPESQWNYQARTGSIAPSNTTLRQVNPNWAGGTSSNAMLRHDGFSNTNTLQAEVERRFNNGLMFQAFYTFTHAMTTTDAGGRASGTGNINSSSSGSSYVVPQNLLIMGEPNLSDSQLLNLGYANSTEIPAQHFRWNGIYDLPFGKGKHFGKDASGAMNMLIGGWQLAFNGDLRGGFWMGVNSSKYLFGDPAIPADQRLTMNIFGKQQQLWFKGYFDPTQATGVDLAKLEQLVPADPYSRVLRPVGSLDNRIPQVLANGTVRSTSITDMLNWNARNFFRGPGAWNQDLSIFKTIPFRERFKLRLTGDFFNAFNHPTDLAPDSNTGLLDLSRQANDPRIIQFSARVEW